MMRATASDSMKISRGSLPVFYICITVHFFKCLEVLGRVFFLNWAAGYGF